VSERKGLRHFQVRYVHGTLHTIAQSRARQAEVATHFECVSVEFRASEHHGCHEAGAGKKQQCWGVRSRSEVWDTESP
jgi:hypothetical protein